MANFDVVLKWNGINEGGFSTSKKDNGNYISGKAGVGLFVGTNHGVSGKFIYDNIFKGVTEKWMRAMTKSYSADIFRKHFWNGLGFDKLDNDSLSYQFFDHRMNRGNLEGLKLKLKQKHTFFNSSVKTKLTDLEIEALNRLDSEDLYKDVQIARNKDYYDKRYINPGAYPDWIKRPYRVPYQKKKPEPIRDLIILSPLIVLTGLILYFK